MNGSSTGVGQPRCWSCHAFLSRDVQNEDGYHCDNCYDEPSAAELEMNGWEYNGTQWVRTRSDTEEDK